MSGTDHPVATIDAAPLLASPGVISVVEALASGERDVRFVGGCVRDLLVDRDIADIDVATPDTPDEVTRLLEDRGIKVVPTGLSHGTVTAVVEGRGIEVTTLRVDVATDGRHAEVAFTGDWQADAARRDFTINAMSLRPSGDLFDYFGGRGDLADGRVRFVGDAAGRIAEDRLRVLRYFRFLALYGHGVPDRQAMTACASARSCLGASGGRTHPVRTLRASGCSASPAGTRSHGLERCSGERAAGGERIDHPWRPDRHR